MQHSSTRGSSDVETRFAAAAAAAADGAAADGVVLDPIAASSTLILLGGVVRFRKD